MKQRSKINAWWIPLFFALSACSGAIDGPVAGGGPLGAPNGNFAQGTLGSQPDIQQMSNECLSLYTMRFNGEVLGENSYWIPIQEDQKHFPSPGLILKVPKNDLPNEEICPNCEGRVVRVIDFGNPGLNPLRFRIEFSMFMVGLWKDSVKPEILSQAHYQDFPVSAVSDVSFKGYPIVSGNLYVLVISNQEREPITEATAFASAEELYGMMGCSKHPEELPFTALRAFVASPKDPQFSVLPPPGGVTISIPQPSDKEKNQGPKIEHNTSAFPAEKSSPDMIRMKDED